MQGSKPWQFYLYWNWRETYHLVKKLLKKPNQHDFRWTVLALHFQYQNQYPKHAEDDLNHLLQVFNQRYLKLGKVPHHRYPKAA